MTPHLAQHPTVFGAVDVGGRGGLAEVAGEDAIGADITACSISARRGASSPINRPYFLKTPVSVLPVGLVGL
jgi:hypothetical protein